MSIEYYNLGTSLCRVSSDKGGVCVFIHKLLKFILVNVCS
jgi:hypothetical protein